MKFQEVIYQVNGFDGLQQKLKILGAKSSRPATSIHYYTKQKGDELVKLGDYGDKIEIRFIDCSAGKFKLKRNIPVTTTEEGLDWLKKHGFDRVEIIKMTITDYEYKNGIVSLNVVNDFLPSVILDFPGDDYKPVEKELGLESAKKIDVTYNKFLAQMSKLKSITL